ncbi:MAG: 30S ribosome-binding factor RbfA [Coriobacteriia bacterium]|nr:30S ribosome-binding factor RbfA [Coriobacteriia bacterium]
MTRRNQENHVSKGIRKSDEQLREVLSIILMQEINDPRIEFVVITSVDLNSDRSVADVFVSTDPDRYDAALAGLESAHGRIRSLAAHALGWREMPELRFKIDPAIDAGARIDAVIEQEQTR